MTRELSVRWVSHNWKHTPWVRALAEHLARLGPESVPGWEEELERQLVKLGAPRERLPSKTSCKAQSKKVVHEQGLFPSLAVSPKRRKTSKLWRVDLKL